VFDLQGGCSRVDFWGTERGMQQRFVGSKLPPALARLEWRRVSEGSDQEYALDCFENEWRRDDPELIHTTVQSEYRPAVSLPVFIAITAQDVIDGIEVEAYVSYGLGTGRPEDLSPQVRELHQVERMIKSLFKETL
jgi:hypothetical protein